MRGASEGEGEARAERHPSSIWSGPSKFTAVQETLPKPTTELRARGPGPFPEEPACRDSVLSQDATSNEAERNSWPALSPSCRPLWALRSTALAVKRTVWPLHSPTASTPAPPTSASPGLIWPLLGLCLPERWAGQGGSEHSSNWLRSLGKQRLWTQFDPLRVQVPVLLAAHDFLFQRKKTWGFKSFFFLFKKKGFWTQNGSYETTCWWV